MVSSVQIFNNKLLYILGSSNYFKEKHVKQTSIDQRYCFCNRPWIFPSVWEVCISKIAIIMLETSGFLQICTTNSNHRDKVRSFWGRHSNTNRIESRRNLTPKNNCWSSIEIRSQIGEKINRQEHARDGKLLNIAGTCKSKLCFTCAKQSLSAIFFGQRCSLNAIKWFHPCVSSTSSSSRNISGAAMNSRSGERSSKAHTCRSESKLTQTLFVSIIKSNSTKSLRFSIFQAGAQETR